VTLRAGVAVDTSNRDDTEVLPVLGISHRSETGRGSHSMSLEFAGTSQVPGYTALKSNPAGLFGGNPDLGRERAEEVTLSFVWETASWRTELTGFYRQDDDLVDWTFASGTPNARQANAVDVDVAGAIIGIARSWSSLQLVAAYTYLDKDADYGAATVDASFYALNFARHRATLAMRFDVTDSLQLRLDNEYRRQEENALRASSDNAFLVSASLAWAAANRRGLSVALSADNLTDDDYEQFPGTPAVGRQLSLGVRYDW
jgi:outer membrane receptor protein involved in Fe transport